MPYRGAERRRFRRVDLRYPVSIELLASTPTGDVRAIEGVTENLSFGGALVGVSDTSTLRGASPVVVRFVEQQRAAPVALPGVIWRREEPGGTHVAVEFDAPLLSYEGAVEIADRVQWLREMGGEAFARDNVDRFLDTVPEGIRSVRQSSAAGDLQAVAQVARSLKLSAGNVGAVNLYEMARRTELAARQEDAAAVAHLVERLPQYFEAVRAELQHFA